MMLKSLVFLSLLIAPLPTLAQSVSVEDLQKQIDAEVNKVNPYAELLNDPDPKRAQAAMKVMLESGDPVLVDLALEFGLFSPDRVVRTQALVGYFDTLPRLDVMFDGSNADPAAFEADAKTNFLSGVSQEGSFFWTPKILAYNANNDCYGVNSDGSYCLIQIRKEGVRLMIQNTTWYELELTEDGALIGVVNLLRSKDVSVRIQLY